jgi:L-malate glycosyltransferase
MDNYINRNNKKRNIPKICIVSRAIPPDFAGAGKRAFNQAKYIAQKGHKVALLTSTICNYNVDNLEILTIKLPIFYKNKGIYSKILRFLYNPILLLKIMVIMKRNKYEIIHCIPGNTLFSMLSVLAAKILIKKVITETTLIGSDDPISLRKSRLGFIKFYIFNLSDIIVNISPLLFEACKKAKINNNKLYVIGNSVNTSKFAKVSIQDKIKIRQKLGLNNYKSILLYVGILRPRKGVDSLIRMFNHLSKEIHDICLVLAGPIDKDEENILYTEQLRKIVNIYNLNSKVIFKGEISNVDEYMKASDIFVFASKREGFGTVLVEAMSTGLPVVTTKISKITEYIIKNNYDGIIVKNERELLSKVRMLLDDRQVYNFISMNARNTAKNKFSEDVIMKSYFNIYNNLLKEKVY